MRIEWWILLSVYLVATGIFFFIPKHKLRLAVVAFLIQQSITFATGLVVVEWGLLEYPVRLFFSRSIERASLLSIMLFQSYVPPLMSGIPTIEVLLFNWVITLDIVPF